MPAPPPLADTAAILVAAGSSRRLGMDKLAWSLAGKPVLLRSLEALLAAPSIASVVIVCPIERWELLAPHHFAKPVVRTDGGAERQDSVTLGIAAADPALPYIAVHDAARPLVSPDDIEICVAAARTHGAASLASRATATMKRADAEDFTEDAIVQREGLWCMETPQAFDAALLNHAIAHVQDQHLCVTDEVSAAQAIGARVKLIASTTHNLKITTPADLALAQALATLAP